MTGPLAFQWQGDAFAPLRRHHAACVERFAIGEVVALEVIEDRSSASHRQFFAALNDAYASLPDGIAERYHSVEHFRKHLLVKAGWCDHTQHACQTRAEADRMRLLARRLDDYAIVTVTHNVVDVYTARSQSYRGMDRKAFQAVKERVLALVADMLGAAPADVRRHAEERAHG